MYNINGDAVVDFDEQPAAQTEGNSRKKILAGILWGSAAIGLAALGLVALQRRCKHGPSEVANS